MRIKSDLLCGLSVCALLASPAAAQEAAPAQQSGSSAARADESGGDFGDIVVTAQRREQRLQDVPISISAINAAALANAGATGTSQLQSAVPNLVMQRQVGAAVPFLRGVGFSTGEISSESSVAIYIDGVYQPTSFTNFFDFNNIERIEVLKGPQGTLFGRNATGGVIQVITKTPSFKPQMDFDIGYANYQTVKASGYVSAGLTDTVAASVAIQYADQNKGWGRNLITGAEVYYARDFNARGKLLFEPSDGTSILISGNYSQFDRNNSSGQNSPGSILVTGQGFLGRYNVAGNLDSTFDGETYGGSATITHDFGGFQIKNIAAYQKFTGFQTIDQDMSPLPVVDGFFNLRSRMISEEFHVLSPADTKFQWLAGLYYLNYNAAFDPLDLAGLAFSPLPGVSVFGETRTQSIAAFAQGTYPIATDLNLTLGIRYSRDRSRYTGSENILGTAIVIDPEQIKVFKSKKPTWRISVDYKFTPDILGYVSYNRGVKSGNFANGTAPSFNEPYQPEQLDAYEAGVKTELFDKSVIFNTSAFYYDFKNIQFQRIDAGVVAIVNGPSAKVYGLEAELTGKITPNFTLTANGSYLHTEIGDFPNAPNTRRLPSGLTDFGDPNFNAKGNRLPSAPKFSGNVGFQYQIPLEDGRIKLGSNLLYTGKIYTELDNRLFVKEHVVLNASLGWEGDDGMRVSVWGNNLTNSYYYAYLTGVGGLSDLAIPAAPRTYGVTLGYSFR